VTTPSAFLVDVRRDGDDAIVAVTGEVDIATGPTLWSRIQRAMADGASRLVIDLAGTTFMDSTGLAIIIRAAGVHGADNVYVRSPQPRVLALFELTGLRRHILIVADGETADRPPPEDVAASGLPPATGA
jgi:anti-anti-sigma factor